MKHYSFGLLVLLSLAAGAGAAFNTNKPGASGKKKKGREQRPNAVAAAALTDPIAHPAPTAKDLLQTKGSLLYKGLYTNDPTKRTRAVLAGNFSSYDGTTVSLFTSSRVCSCL